MIANKQKYEKWGQLRKINKSKYEIFDEWSKYYLFLYPPLKKLKKSNFFQSINFDECFNVFFVYTFLLRENNFFSQKTESSLEQ